MKNLISKIKKLARRTIALSDLALVRVCSRTRFSASIYYMVMPAFRREQHSVLSGRLLYHRSLSNPEVNTSLLRRNIHRLEKGLLMRPRRVPFGLKYIGETVTAYQKAVDAQTEPTELHWARDVLSEYMHITPAHPDVDDLRQKLKERGLIDLGSSPFSARPRVPYIRPTTERPDISYEQLLQLAVYRRSVRWYLPEPVPRVVIERAIDVAAYSPTACNRQPYEFRVIDDQALLSKVLSLPGGTSGFGHQVPAAAVVVGKQRNYVSERDRHLVYTDASLAIMAFVYALEVQGVGSCCINWPDVEPREAAMSRLLKLAPDERPVMLVAFGYPDPEGLVANSTKKPTPYLCRYNNE